MGCAKALSRGEGTATEESLTQGELCNGERAGFLLVSYGVCRKPGENLLHAQNDVNEAHGDGVKPSKRQMGLCSKTSVQLGL